MNKKSETKEEEFIEIMEEIRLQDGKWSDIKRIEI